MAKTNKSLGDKRRRIGRQGENLARSLLEDLGLTPRKDEVDDGEDFWIELCRNDGRWERVGVQVKASEKFSIDRDKSWRVRLKPASVMRYRRAAHLVVVLAVDVTTKAIRWAPFPDLDSNAALTLLMDKERALGASEGQVFSGALLDLLTEHHAKVHSPSRVLADQAAALQALDSDIEVKIAATPQGTTVHLGISPSSTSVLVDGEPVVEVDSLRSEAERFGVPATLVWRNARLAGSPLLEALADAPLLTQEIPAQGGLQSVRVGWQDDEGAIHHLLDTQSWLSVGKDGALVRMDDPALPLCVEGRWPIDPGPEVLVSLLLRIEPWIDAPFARLPYWDSVWDLVSALALGAPLTLTFRDDGYDSDPLILGPDIRLREWAAQCRRMLRPLHTLVAAARHTKSSATLTGDSVAPPSVALAESLEQVAGLLTGDVISVPPLDVMVPDDLIVTDFCELPAELVLTWRGQRVATLATEYLLVFYAAVPCDEGCGKRLTPTSQSETYMRLAQRDNGHAGHARPQGGQ